MESGLVSTLLAGFALYDAVKASTEHGDGGTDGGLHRDLVAERQDGETDHENTLTDITDGVCHRGDLAERLVRDLVVHVIVETDRQQSHDEIFLALEGDSARDASRHGGTFEEQRERNAEEQRNNRHVVVQVEWSHVRHELLTIDRSRRESNVRGHRGEETNPREGQLRCRGDCDAANDWNQRKVHRQRVHGAGD